jgi:hypothetical protein
MKDFPNKENIRVAKQMDADSDLYELATGQVLTSEELNKLQGLNPELFWIVVKFDKKLLPTENN